MPYYVAAPVPTAPNLNVAPILGAMANANQQMSEAGKIIAGSVKDMGQQFQDKQDAEFYSQVNQYANDPVALAQAMQNGSINTRGVSQQALNDYTNKARDIAATYAVNREAQEKNYLNNQYMQHKDLLLQAQAAASKGDLEGAQKIYASAIERGMDPRVLKDFDALSGYSTLQQLELAKQRNALVGAGYSLQLQQYNDRLNKEGGDLLSKALRAQFGDALFKKGKLSFNDIRAAAGDLGKQFGLNFTDEMINRALIDLRIDTPLVGQGNVSLTPPIDETPSTPPTPKATAKYSRKDYGI